MNAEEEFAHQGGDGEGTSESGDDAERDKPSGFLQDELIDRTALCAEGHAYSDFTRALADGVGDDSVEPDDAEQKRENGEAADEPCRGAMQVGGLRVVDLLRHGGFIADAD